MVTELSCLEFEDLLSDYREGTLGPEAQAGARRHLLGCAPCSALLAEVGAAVEALAGLPELAPPPSLAAAIFARTLDPRASHGVHPRSSFRHLWAALTSPRFALGFAMAVFACALLLNAAQINLRTVSWRDLSMTRASNLLQRNVERSWAHGVAYYHDLRVVYEIEAALHQMRQAPPPTQPAGHDHTPSQVPGQGSDLSFSGTALPARFNAPRQALNFQHQTFNPQRQTAAWQWSLD